MRITLISDTHGKHEQLTKDLPGGDLLLHAGDSMTSGYLDKELTDFCKWFEKVEGYKEKIFIAGNHCRIFEDFPDRAMEIVNSYPSITYLQDASAIFEGVNIYGSPWQPAFYDWAFNLKRNSLELATKWDGIPRDTDILITHGPAYGTLDTVRSREYDWLGCELLALAIEKIRPKMHLCGHIHSGHGYEFKDGTHFFNASVLDERYNYAYKPFTFDWDEITNEIKFL